MLWLIRDYIASLLSLERQPLNSSALGSLKAWSLELINHLAAQEL